MITKRIIVVCLVGGLLSGCTSKNELEDTKIELASVKKQLIYTKEKLNTIENQNLELNEELKNMANITDTDIETKAISLKLLTSYFSTNNSQGVQLPILHGLVFAEHTSPYFSYIKNGEVKETDSSIKRYFGNLGDFKVENYFLHLVLSKSVEVPLSIRNDTNKIITNDILFVIDPENKLPKLFIKTNNDTYSIYECDVRGMSPYNPDIWINQLIKHYYINDHE